MKTIIIGAGFAGLSAGHKLKQNFTILEKNSRPGGLCRSESIKGFTFDYTGHFLHLRKPETQKFIFKNVKTPLLKVARKAFIFSNNVYTGYPYQINSYGLPGDIAAENLIGFIRAKMKGEASVENFKKWVSTALGEGIAKNFMFPYNLKLLKYPLDKLTIKWLGRFVPNPTIDEVMQGLLPKGKQDAGYNAYFYYPQTGGIEAVIKGIYEPIKPSVRLDSAVKKIDTKGKIVYYGDGHSLSYTRLLSTMPLKELLNLTGDKALKKLGAKLIATSVYSLNIGYKPAGPIGRHWVYVPEAKYPYYRIGFPSEVAQSAAPAGMSSVFTEVSFRGKPPAGIDTKVIKGLLDMGVIRSKKDIKVKYPMVLKDAYVIYNEDREKIMPEITKRFEEKGIFLAGRWGQWEYSSMEDAILEGFEAAERILKS